MPATTSAAVILRRSVPLLSERSLAAFAGRAARFAMLQGSMTVLVTSSREMRVLNQRFRGKAYPTDVLSFPPPSFVEGYAGDIAVSLDIASRNARSLGHSVADEVRILVLHGILHLAGYDHEDDGGEMASREARLRRQLRLPAALIERATPPKSRGPAKAVRLRR